MFNKFLLVVLSLICLQSFVIAHCQIPCGIYDDEMRFTHLAEHIHTIEKSMLSLNNQDLNDNQQTRWVLNKENHADEFSRILQSYFLTQRLKPVTDSSEEITKQNYLNQLQLVHELMVLSMKAKQSTNLEHINKLNDKLNQFKQSYFQK